ncbi:MAG: hypothetical protein ACI9JN_000696 [Bacteroidia bacterium]|jgi:hypothetical protein
MLLGNLTYGQDQHYLFTNIHTAMFDTTNKTELCLAFNNNYLDFGYARQFKNLVLTVAVKPRISDQGGIRLPKNTGLFTLSQVYLNHAYSEVHVTQRKTHRMQKLFVGGGLGYQSHKDMLRVFGQLDWGNESPLMNAGFSLRASMYQSQNETRLRLEPAVTGKFKFGRMRLISQLGYSILADRRRVPMALLMSFGLSYVV